MKKLYTVLLSAGIAAGLFAAGQGDAGNAKNVTLRFGVDGNTASVEYAVAQKFAATLEQLSGGTVKAELFPNGQLGNAKEMIQQITMNELDAYMEPMGGVSTLIPELAVLESGYVVRDLDHLDKIMASEWGVRMQKKMQDEFNMRVISSTLFGARQTSSNRPLHTINDYKNLRIRIPNSRGIKDWAEAVGARPTSIAFSEVYLALKTNSVDAQENPLPTIESMKFYEAQNAVAIDNHIVQDKSILFSQKRWESLSKQQQEWIMQAGKAAKDESIKRINENSEKIIAFFKSRGLTITYPDTAPMRKAMAPKYAALEKELGVEGLIAKLAAL
ncbi:DctP family TRAP transporter solute-binding subunit [Treponema socranskii]|uniref:DctP family TRAP transporter solute-binding subunit n=1 Tax=Treponema socranskii TaxID=53419 RepID=UPI002871E0F0|nr:DctP family TRAP transporter solute-binding subunit [Treponema socranskii]MDR9858992.1 DctP family TRAP transporter solute-binding subunit [Treponema socranskii]